MSKDAARMLSSADAARTGGLQYEILIPDVITASYRFSLAIMPEWLDEFSEDWLEEPGSGIGLPAQPGPCSQPGRLCRQESLPYPMW